jgi:hypothetical protein
MKQVKSVGLLMALGLITTLGACSSDSTTEAGREQPVSSPRVTSPAVEGGEGGEGGEEGAALSTDADVNYMVTLGLMKGHLIVAKELLDQGKHQEAEPHIGHPVEELYSDIEAELPDRNVADFKGNLNQLHDLVKSKPTDPQLVKLYTEAMQKVDGAIAALPADKRTSPQFVVESINGILAVAGEEYVAAIADNKFVELVEYQDSRGFVRYATELYATVAEQVAQSNPQVDQSLKKHLAELARAWPAVNPPDTPILPPPQVQEQITQFKTAAQQLT